MQTPSSNGVLQGPQQLKKQILQILPCSSNALTQFYCLHQILWLVRTRAFLPLSVLLSLWQREYLRSHVILLRAFYILSCDILPCDISSCDHDFVPRLQLDYRVIHMLNNSQSNLLSNLPRFQLIAYRKRWIPKLLKIYLFAKESA